MEYTIKNFLDRKFAVEIKTLRDHERFCETMKGSGIKWNSGRELVDFFNRFGGLYYCYKRGENTALVCQNLATSARNLPAISIDEFVKANQKQDSAIVIYADGKKTVALMKDGKSVVKRAEAKCSPEDEFDFRVGAEIAFRRLIGRSPLGGVGITRPAGVSGLTSTSEPVCEVQRPAKEGEYVRLDKDPEVFFARKGDICKCKETIELPGLFSLTYLETKHGFPLITKAGEYVVLENYTPKEEEK